MKILSPFLASVIIGFIILGCTFKGNHKLTKYDINCSSCTMKIKYDVDIADDDIQIKGL